jgi:hypothetical protein
MVAPDGTVNPAIGAWSEPLEVLHRLIAGRFARSEARERVRRYACSVCSGGWNARTAGRSPRPWEKRTPKGFSVC